MNKAQSLPRCFRIVADARTVSQVEDFLLADGFAFEPEPFSPFCRRLLAGPAPLGASLAAFFGYIYIQDRSSMLPPLALDPEPGRSVLDMAASPGGKTGFLCQLAGNSGFVLANEPAKDRLATLRANLNRSNLLPCATCSYSGEKLPLAPGSFGHILLDPPCSGWGTLNKNPQAAKIWQGDKISRLVSIQKKLLAHAAFLLAPGGKLLYSTCTTNPRENEEQTAYAINSLGLEPEPITPFPGFTFEQKTNGMLVDGGASLAQSFYLCLLRKKGGEVAEPPAMQPPDACPDLPGLPIPRSNLASPVFDPALLPPGEVMAFGGKARFLPQAAALRLPVGIRWQGFLLGKFQAGRFTPSPRLRACMPPPDRQTAVVFEETAPIRRFLAGGSLQTGIKTELAGIWWRHLPLGICAVKNGRLVAGFR